ncbi:hypothetical protein INS49_000436 [Diaporthe citri]|uniref:uncharacterized protein n=1 Tax=Diaporthe citri TaxID=83186 RepID=UPI001C7E914C|nr:uncharacterized protein INS49_000436 [Diaporthe citri]KAG6366260.1 hypothetical protein INS49_000436 [Diaporthe citri]
MSGGRRSSVSRGPNFTVAAALSIGCGLVVFVLTSILLLPTDLVPDRFRCCRAWIQLIRPGLLPDTVSEPDIMFKEVLSSAGVTALVLPGQAAATLLYATAYLDTITTLSLKGSSLQAIASTPGCGANSSWLTPDYANNRIYCLDEGLTTPNGTLSSFALTSNGTLSQLDIVDTLSGPVSGVIYGETGNGLALAHYSGSSVAAFDISDASTLAPVQAETYTLDAPGPIPDRQDAPHPHQALLDPTGQYLLVPDLGSDVVRLYSVDEGGLSFTELEPLAAVPGSGPRHGVFLVTDDGTTYFYLASELANTVTGFEVTYNDDNTLDFTEVYLSSTHGLNGTVPNNETTAAEIAISPDNKFLLVSSRGEGTLRIPNFDPANSTEIVSDPIFTFEIDHSSGALTKIQQFPAGGSIPRQFSISADGSLVAVGLQNDGRVVVIGRDVETGLLTDFVASADVGGQPTSVIFAAE